MLGSRHPSDARLHPRTTFARRAVPTPDPQVLDLYGNRVADAGARALVDALATNESLVELDLRANGLSEGEKRRLEDAAPERVRLLV